MSVDVMYGGGLLQSAGEQAAALAGETSSQVWYLGGRSPRGVTWRAGGGPLERMLLYEGCMGLYLKSILASTRDS